MNKTKPVGLIASGRMIDSPLGRFPSLTKEIGPVVATSRRLASRYANALRAGRPADPEALAECRLIVVQTTPLELAATLQPLLDVRFSLRGRAVVLLDDEMNASDLDPLRQRRAVVCAATLTPPPEHPLMAAEGDASAIRAVRAWAAAAHIKCVELRSGAKPLYSAALVTAGSLLTPLLDAAFRSLRASGLTQQEARRIMDYVVDSALRAHKAHGRKAWQNPAPAARTRALQQQLAALHAVDPALADFYRLSLVAALDFFSQSPEWLSHVRT